MKVKDAKTYEDWKAKQKDDYSLACFRYAEKWADLMESEIDSGAKVKDIADRTSHEADTEGITGFMYGASVSILSQCWLHGEELRKWHNKEYEYEGDGVVNPAVLTVKTNK
ncbi:hypothetical protein JK635_02090 [Neobacillus sp. YIM B02564]|uniref:Uncharacterized protein n=1 Tax=Neobacillus paridis TaxID=2803862 RepID=A0ABS1TJV5_9BACI|nr:hypothetical protein [Neobacillus paridis]MBL4951029.1 hypothetical protein [Neobacillus paridis]